MSNTITTIRQNKSFNLTKKIFLGLAVACAVSTMSSSLVSALPYRTPTVANQENTGFRTPIDQLTLVSDTTIDAPGDYDGVKFAPGSPVVVTADFVYFNDAYFPSGLVFKGSIANRVTESTIVGGLSLNSSESVSFSHVEVRGGVNQISIVGTAAAPTYNTSLDAVWVHGAAPKCGEKANGVYLRNAQGLFVDTSNFDMGPWRLGCDGQEILNAAFNADAAGNGSMGIYNTNLNGGAVTFRRGAHTGDFPVNNVWFGADYGHAQQYANPVGEPAQSTNNKQITQTTPQRLVPIVVK